jgi:Peptidase A4 family
MLNRIRQFAATFAGQGTKSLSSTLTAVALLAAPLAGIAQNTPHKLQPNEHALNLPGTTTIDAPAAGFDPLTASDEDLAYYGFPPRPNQNTEQKAYATWAKAITASKVRIVPQLAQTEIYHGPAKQAKASSVDPTAGEKNLSLADQPSNTLNSYNWSGYVDFSGATSYGSNSYYFLVNDYTVPVAEQAFGACTGGWDYGSAWNGIDGWGSRDVLQAGIEFDAYCALGGLIRSTYYSAWYEWFPNGEVRISNFPIAPGDAIFVEVWHTSSTQGYAYLVNCNSKQAVEVGFTAPSGTYLVGNSAEWVVERPKVNGSLATLTNYIMDPFWDAFAYTEGYASFNDIDEATPVDMLDNSSHVISYPEYEGIYSFVMHDTGSAY